MNKLVFAIPFIAVFALPMVYGDTSVNVAKGSSVPGCEEVNQCYIPYKVQISKGGTVTWNNIDSAAHTVTAGNGNIGLTGEFDSGLFMASATFSHTFESSGTFDYFCMVHPWMTGIVVVGEGKTSKLPESPTTREERKESNPINNNEEIKRLINENNILKSENTELKSDNRNLRIENDRLLKEINLLKDQLISMTGEFMETVKQLNEWFRKELTN